METDEPKPQTGGPSLQVDFDAYEPLFDDPTISDEDKRRLLETLWSLVMTFAQLGWNAHPVQHARAARKARAVRGGQVAESADDDAEAAGSVVELNDQVIFETFGNAARSTSQRASES